MARNAKITKMRSQRFRKRRGNFRPFTDDILNQGQVFIHNDLKPYWSENIKLRPRGGGQSRVDKSDIPLSHRAYVDYRAHAKTLGLPDEGYELTPQRVAFLRSIIPGVQFSSAEKRAAEQLMNRLAGELPDEYFASVVVERSRFQIIRMFYNGPKSCVFFVMQDHQVFRRSITYGSPERAKAVFRGGEIRWHVEHVLNSS